MAINPDGTFSIDLSVFGGEVTDVAAGNLPPGSSPAAQDMFFSAQYVATRPALKHELSAALVSGFDVFSHNDFPQQTGQTDLVMLYSNGSLWTQNVQTGTETQIGTVTAGSRFKSVAAFNHFFIAARNLALTSPFTSAQLAGGDVPRYINALGHVWKVVTDAPGGGLGVTPLTIQPEDIVTPGTYALAATITNITMSDPTQSKVATVVSYVRPIEPIGGGPIGGGGGGGGPTNPTPNPPNPVTTYQSATVTVSPSVSLTAGQIVQLYNITWSPAGGPQWPNGVTVTKVISGTQFQIALSGQTTLRTASGGSMAYDATNSISLVRNNNIVTAYLAETSSTAPTIIQPGWYVTVTDKNASSTATLPNGTVPFIANELFQAIYPNNTVSAVPTLLTGTVMNFYTYSHSNGGAFNFDYPGDGFDEVLPTPIATFTFGSNNSILINPNGNPAGNFLPGGPNDYSTLPWTIPGLNSSGSWDSTVTVPYSGAKTDIAAVIYGSISFPSAGTYSFEFVNDDGMQMGFGPGVTFVSSTGSVDGGQFNPQPHSKTALNGYPIMYAQNASTNFGGVSIYQGTVTISIAAAGVYQFEINYVNWEGAAVCVMTNYKSGSSSPIQITAGPATASLQGDGLGNVHVTLPMAIEGLPIGSWLYIYVNPAVQSYVQDWSISSNGTGLITVPNGNFVVGTQILLNGFTSVSNPEPTGWNGQTVSITAVDGDSYQFAWTGPSGSGTSTTGTATPVNASYPSGFQQVTQVISPTEFVYYATGNIQTLIATGTVYDYFGSLNTQQALTAAIQQTSPGTVVANAAQSSSGIVQGFQVLSVDTNVSPNIITWFQSGFNDTYTGTHTLQVQPQTQIAGGPRSLFCFFINEDGGTTPGSYPINVQLNGGSQFVQVTLPLGPPNTTARGVAWTSAYGSDFFVLPPSIVPAQGGNAPIMSTGTIIYDNTTTETVMDFSDPALQDSIFVGPGEEAVGEDYGDLTAIIVLPPQLGVIEYNQQLIWWGELNNYPNHTMINMGFDGGYTPQYKGAVTVGSGGSAGTLTLVSGTEFVSGLAGSTISLFEAPATGSYTISSVTDATHIVVTPHPIGPARPVTHLVNTFLGTTPLGWDDTTEYNSITPDQGGELTNSSDGLGFAYLMTSTTGGANCMISQGACKNALGTPIVLPNRNYTMRFQSVKQSGTASGNLEFVFYSPNNGVISTATVANSSFTSTNGWYSANFNNVMPNVIPNDMVFYVTFSGNSTAFAILIDDLQIIDSQQPVLNNQLRVSYIDNPFGYDNENGFVIGLDTTDFIAGCFLQRSFLYALTQNEQHTILANANLPSEWSATLFAKECGCSGPDSVTTGQSTAWWMGRHGVQVFEGAQPKKISQPEAQRFEQTNWNAAVNSCMAYDSIQRQLWMSFPTGQSTNNSFTMTMNSRLNDAQINVPDPVHVSGYTGKLITTDLAQKWCPVSVAFNSLNMCTRNTPFGYAKVMTFGGAKGGPTAADTTAKAQAASGNLKISLTPDNSNDFVMVCTSAFNTSSGNTPAGWTRSGEGFYTIQASNANLLTFNAASPSPSEWTAVMASFAVSGTPTVETNTNIDFGSGPEAQYTHTLTASAGDCIVWQFSSYSQTAPTFSISDTQSNAYVLYQNTQQINSGLYYTAFLAVALGCKAGSTVVTMNIANYGTPSGSTGFVTDLINYSGISGPVSFGQIYSQDFLNYPPVNPSSAIWNAVDADYGTIPWLYTTYFFFSHDTEQQPMLALYRKLFAYMSIHVTGVGFLDATPFVDAFSNEWPTVQSWTLSLTDPGIDNEIGLNVVGNRMAIQFSGTPIPISQGGDGESTAMLITHMIVSGRKDNVFPVRGAL